MWPHGQAVKTPPFHGGNMGSSPVGVTKQVKSEPVSFRRRIRLYHILQKDLLNGVRDFTSHAAFRYLVILHYKTEVQSEQAGAEVVW